MLKLCEKFKSDYQYQEKKVVFRQNDKPSSIPGFSDDEDDDIVESIDNDEVCVYLKKPKIVALSNPFEWWNNQKQELPHLSKMAKDYLAIPSSSLAPERANSRARHLWEDRSQLSDNVFRMEMCLRSWYERGISSSDE